MSIRRAPHQTDYAVIHNAALRDPTLSFKARGLLALLLSMPDEWRVSGLWLAEQGPDGKAAVWSGLRELESAGYLRRGRYRGESGQWVHESVVYESPNQPDCPDSDLRGTDNRTDPAGNVPVGGEEPNSGFPSSENRCIEEVPTDEVPTERGARATRIPLPWNLSNEMIAWVERECPGVDWETESATFVDHFKAAAGRNAVKRDWLATWKNWMRREAKGAFRR